MECGKVLIEFLFVYMFAGTVEINHAHQYCTYYNICDLFDHTVTPLCHIITRRMQATYHQRVRN